MAQRQITYSDAISEAMREEMLRDNRVFLMGEDVGKFGGSYYASRGLYHEFGPERVKDTPISETSIIGSALGAALLGMRPVVEIMRIDFMTTCMDEIVNQVAKMRYLSGGAAEVPVVIKINTEGGVGLGAHHSQSFESWLVHIPGLKVVIPSNPYDCKGLLKAAIRDPNPIIFLECIALLNSSCVVPTEEYVVPIGKAEIKREGTDATVVTWGSTVPKALNAADSLAIEGIQLEVIDLRTLSPLDTQSVIHSVEKTGRLVVAHEAVKTCGLGAEVAAFVQEESFYCLKAPIKRVATPYVIIPVNRTLEKMLLPQEGNIIEAVKSVLP